MRKLISRLVLPLTFLSYLVVDKWWYVHVENGPDVVVHGFPVISNAPSADNSLELVYFIPETIINITSHFLFWLALVFIVHTWIVHLWLPSIVAKIFNGLLVIWLIAFTWFFITYHADFSLDHDTGATTLDSGFEWSWQNTPPPDYSKYHPISPTPNGNNIAR